jgi:hypothetical protein
VNSSLLVRSILLASVVSATGCLDTGSLMAPTGQTGGAGTGDFGLGGTGPASGGAAGKADAGSPGAPPPTGAGGGAGAAGLLGCTMNGLIAHYTFDTDTTDSSGNGNDIVATSVTPTTGIFGGAYLFQFSSLMRVTGGTDSLAGDRTLCAWVNPQSVTGTSQPVFAGGDVSNGDFFSLTSSTPMAANAGCMGSTEGEPIVNHGNTCVDGTGLIAPNGRWSLVCYVSQAEYYGTYENFFVNGRSVGTYGENFSYPLSTLTIGSQTISGTSTAWSFRGAIDDVTIWGRALSLQELNALWNGGLGCSPKTSTGIALVTGADGQLESNAAGAVGRWTTAGDYYAVDGTPGGGNCPIAGFPATACSSVTTPVPGTPFVPDANGRMCAAGTVAQVVTGSDGTPAWSAIWGSLIELYLATPDSTAAPAGTYDATAHGITGFAFDVEGTIPYGQLRVLVGTAENDTNSAYWDGAMMDVSPYQGPGRYEIRWPDVGGPQYLGPGAPPFDPTKIEYIGLALVARPDGQAPYDFCISNLTLLTN